MRRFSKYLVIFVGIGIGLWLVSFAIEGLRSTPQQPDKLAWAEDIVPQRMDLDGVNVRYVKTGNGPNLVLLHTLRTQLDIFQGLIPELSKRYTVYAVDYPGHGWSDIPDAQYHPDDFYSWVEKFLTKADVQDATVAGISIGGTIALELAARKNPRVARVISINPFDYHESYSAGLKGSSNFARIMFTATAIPFIGETFMRLRNPIVERAVFEGGVADPASLSDDLFNEMSRVGNRPQHYVGFLNLLRNIDHWPEARSRYSKIQVPVLLIYGDQDWAANADREQTAELIPGVKVKVIKDGGHFLSLDKPKELGAQISTFIDGS